MTVMSHAIMQLINYHVYRDLDTSIYALNIMQNTECLWNMDKQLTSDHTLTVVFGNPEHNSSHHIYTRNQTWLACTVAKWFSTFRPTNWTAVQPTGTLVDPRTFHPGHVPLGQDINSPNPKILDRGLCKISNGSLKWTNPNAKRYWGS